MKKIVKFIFLTSPIIFLIIFFMINKNEIVIDDKTSEVLSVQDESDFKIFKTNFRDYEVLISQKINGENIILIANFNDKKTANQIYNENNCKLLTNAGFYKNENSRNLPIGLYILNNNTVSEFEKNNLFNALFYINNFRTPIISDTFIDNDYVYAFQSGPLLIYNSYKTNVSYEKNKKSRRVVLATTTDNKIVILTLYSAKVVFEGPTLGELATLVDEINSEYQLDISDAINLDGGSASAFISNKYMLSESSLIGSAICVK